MKKPIYRLAVISDPQIDLKNAENVNEIEVLKKCFGNMDVDAVAVCGDITENALLREMDAFFDVFKRHCPAKDLFIVPGNMDGVYTYDGEKAYFEALERFFGRKIESLYFAHDAGGCVIVGISPEPADGGTVTDKQLLFLEGVLRDAARRNVPALIFSHYQLTETLDINWKYAALNSDSPKIKPILEKYSGKVIFFSGHTHRGLISETGGSLITKENVTYVSAPSICKPDIVHYIADNDSKGTGYIVDIDSGNIHIRGFDFLSDIWLESFDWTV